MSCEILCNLLRHYEIRRFICGDKNMFYRVCKILFAKGSCANPSATFFCSPCHLKTTLWRLVESGSNQRNLKWFCKANNAMYFKIMVIDEFINNKKEILHAINNPDVIYGDSWISDYLSVIFYIKIHKKYLIKAMKKYGNYNAIMYINRVLKICKSVSIEAMGGPDWRVLDLFNIYNVRNDVKCNNRKCRKAYFKHALGVSDNSMDAFLLKVRQKDKIVKDWRKCKRCQMAFYCGKKCQKYDWNRFGHKNICDLFAKKN
eukprot:473515_1